MKRKTFLKTHLEIYDIDIDFLFFYLNTMQKEQKINETL